MTFTFTELGACADREVGQRRRVYARRVEAGRMSREMAEREIAMMQAIRDHLAELAVKERLL